MHFTGLLQALAPGCTTMRPAATSGHRTTSVHHCPLPIGRPLRNRLMPCHSARRDSPRPTTDGLAVAARWLAQQVRRNARWRAHASARGRPSAASG
jgi:hypothetical protein